MQDSLFNAQTAAPCRVTGAPELTIVVPTLNERDNLRLLVESVADALRQQCWEIIFVDDDSSDGTGKQARALAQHDIRIRCLCRIGRRGLSSACIEGVLASASPFIAIMDADLQHDEQLLPRMLEALRNEPLDLVIGSRYVAGAGLGESLSGGRARASRLATRLARLVCRSDIADPMSGFFMFRREVFEDCVRALSGQGFKILVDLLASSPRQLRIKELPYQFRRRRHGESKLDVLVSWEYAILLADKLFGHVVPVRFALFSIIGATGLLVHLMTLWSVLALTRGSFVAAQTIATLLAMTSNFFLNNLFTYRDKRLRGWKMVRGLFSFYIICGLGAVANVGIAAYVFRADQAWWVAGLAGIIVGSVWNYSVSSVLTWKPR
jgi:dolichol-phosphate mannosyltransferase